MKNLLSILITVLIFSSAVLHAQGRNAGKLKQTEISFMGGYLFNSSYDGYNGSVDLKDSPNYGATISYRPNKASTMTIELEYLGSQVDVELRPYQLTVLDTIETVKVSGNYFLVGVGYGSMVSPKTQLFSMFKLGMIYAVPSSSSRYSSATNFAVSLAAGAKFYLSKSFGIRLQTGIYFPVRFSEGGMYVGTGGVGYGASSSIMQFNLSGGILFAF